MKVINDLLDFNKKIVQDTSYFNFSLDSVLLVNFCETKKEDKVLDICSGNCPIPLMLENKLKNKIYACEIQKEVYDLAIESIKINNLEDKIEVLNMDAKELIKKFETDTFDIITCNPPYFKISEKSIKNDNIVKTNARHELLITLEDIIKISRKLLKNSGKLILVHRVDRLNEIIELTKKYNLEIKRLEFIYPRDNENANMVLIDARKNGKPGLKVLPPIIVHDEEGNYKIEEMFKG